MRLPFYSSAFARHELRVLLASRSIPVFLGFAWALAVLLAFYGGGFFQANRAEATVFLGYLPWVFALVLPALTMQTWAEDFRRGLAERLLTLPMGATTLYITRFMVLWGLLAFWLVGTWPFVVTLLWLGSPDMGQMFAGFIGAWLMGGVILALCLLASSLSRSAVTAYLSAFSLAALVLLSGWAYVTDWASGQVPDMITNALRNISVLENYRRFLIGLLDMRAITFFIGLILVFLALGVAQLARRAERPRLALKALAVALVALLPVVGAPWMNARLDLTAERLYTLSPASVVVLKNLPRLVTISVYDSKTNPDIPLPVREVSRRLTDVLDDVVARSNGRVEVKYINPDADVDLEVKAVEAGLMPQPLGTGEEYFLGVAATMGAAGGKQVDAVIPALSPERMPYLEFDIMSLLTEVQKTNRKSLAVISSVALNTAELQPRFLKDLEMFYDVVYLRPGEPVVPKNISALLVMYSPFLSEESLYAIDQYMAGGGHALLMLDPFVRSGIGASTHNEEIPDELRVPDRNADALAFDHPADLLRDWGVEYSGGSVVADAVRAVPVQQPELGFTAYPLWISLGREQVNIALPFTTFVENMLLSETGYLTPKNIKTGLTYEPVLITSGHAGVINRTIMDDTPPSLLGSKITSPTGVKDLAMLLSGTFTSAFKDVPVSVQQYYRDYAADPAKAVIPPHNPGGKQAGALLAIADTDFIADDFALKPSYDERGNTNGWEPANDNLVFAYNALQYLAGDGGLLGLRGKAVQNRRFTKVEELMTQKAVEYQKVESKFIAELFTVSQRLQELKGRQDQAKATDADMEKEVETFRKREMKLKKQLREIRKGLRKGVYRLERGLLIANMLTMPLIALGGAAYIRHRRRKAKA